jgi:hypothetical protein
MSAIATTPSSCDVRSSVAIGAKAAVAAPAQGRSWHKADIAIALNDVRFRAIQQTRRAEPAETAMLPMEVPVAVRARPRSRARETRALRQGCAPWWDTRKRNQSLLRFRSRRSWPQRRLERRIKLRNEVNVWRRLGRASPGNERNA